MRLQVTSTLCLLLLSAAAALSTSHRSQAQACGTLSGSSITIGSDCTGPAAPDASVNNLTVSAAINSATNGIEITNALNSLTITSAGRVSGASSGSESGVFVDRAINSVVNHGRISGDIGIDVSSAGSIRNLNNASTGNIAGVSTGIAIQTGSPSIGTLTNSGTITGTDAGNGTAISIAGSLETLTNNSSGIIGSSSGAWGINLPSSGTLDSLDNAGRIQGGASEAINVAVGASIGTITNSGIIAGNITNYSTGGMTINGGSGSTFGILTGNSGNTGSADIGTIVNTGSNLRFVSGNIFLNSHVNVSGHALINSGATLRVDNTINVTGTYTQTAGALRFTGSGGSYGQLAISGNATVTGSTIVIAGTGMAAGQTFTVIDAGGTGTYSGNSITMGATNGLSAALSTVGSDLVVTLAADSSNTYAAKSSVAGNTAAQIGGTLDSIRNAASSAATDFQNAVLNSLDTLPAASQGRAMKQLTPTQTSSTAQMGVSSATAVTGAIGQRQQTAQAYPGETGRSAGADVKRSTIWGEALGGGAWRNSTADADGYSLVGYGLIVGLEHQFDDDRMGGAALSWFHAQTDGEGDAAGSSSSLDSYQLTLYGGQRWGHFTLDGQLGAGWNRYDQNRSIGFLGSTASADYTGQQYLARALVGYDIPVGAMLLTPQAGLRLLHARHNGYTEAGAGAANLTINDNSTNSLTHEIGAKLAWDIPTSMGSLRPELRAAWLHDYIDGPISTTGLMGGESFAVTTPRTSNNGVLISLAATLSGQSDLSLRGELQSEFRLDYQSHTGMLRTILAF